MATTSAIQRLDWLQKRGQFGSKARAAKAYGIGYESYKKIMDGSRSLTPEQAEAVAQWHRIPAGWVMFGEGSPEGSTKVPLRGCIGAGQQMMIFEDIGEAGGFVDALIQDTEVMAFEVRGDSMYPLARDRDVIFVGAEQRDLSRLIGSECAVLLEDGRRFFKSLARGSRSGLFDLISYNAEPMRDLAVHSAGRFLGVRRR